MKKGISKLIQWGITIFFGLMTLGAFMDNAISGLCCLFATLLACPAIRTVLVNVMVKETQTPKKKSLFGKKEEKKPDNRKKCGWMLGIGAFLFFIVGVGAVSESTTDTSTANFAVESEIEGIEETESNESVEVSESQPKETAVELSETTSASEATANGVEMPSEMEVHFIDVGQGDATLIKADDKYMLIDAGDNDKGTAVQLYLQKQGVDKLDYLVLTHTDSDHIGGADVIITKFDIDTVLLGDYKKDNETYDDLLNALEYKRLKYSVPEVGSEYNLGNATFTILAPNRTYDTSNNSGIALIIKNGDNSFLFTGDCEAEAEQDILENSLNIDCDVYKVGHHGSNTSSSKAFLEAMTPTYGVISCAEGNIYGHPHAEPLNNLRAMGVKVFRTDEQGSIIAYSDGAEITWNCAPSDTWKAGERTESTTEKEETTKAQPQETTSEENKVQEPVPETPSVGNGSYAVNAKNGKIHIVGACSATGTGKNAMTSPVYFNTYEEAEAYSVSIAPNQDKRQCGNCW